MPVRPSPQATTPVQNTAIAPPAPKWSQTMASQKAKTTSQISVYERDMSRGLSR